jgi:S-adenosylmethionine decarboxylase
LNTHPDHPIAAVTNLQVSAPIQSLGRHILAEFYDCDGNAINNLDLIETVMQDAAKACGATVVESRFHQFAPQGVSGVVIIEESHLAIHTWPELEYAAIDLFTCGDSCDPLVAYEYVRTLLHAGHATYTELRRGLLNPEDNTLNRKPFAVRTQFETDTDATPVTHSVEVTPQQHHTLPGSVVLMQGA